MSNSVFWENDFSNLYGSEIIWAFKIPNHLVLSFDLSLKHFDSSLLLSLKFFLSISLLPPPLHPPYFTFLSYNHSISVISKSFPFIQLNNLLMLHLGRNLFLFSLLVFKHPVFDRINNACQTNPRTYPLIPNEVKTPANFNVQIFNPFFCHDNVLSRGVDFMQSDYYTQDVITSATPCITSQANQIIPSEMKAKLYQSDSISYSSRQPDG